MFKKSRRLVYIVSTLLIIGFLATSLGSYFVSRSSLRSEITHNLLPLTSDNIYSEIQRDLLPPIFISSLMANDTFLRDWVLQGEQNEKLLVKYLNEIQGKFNTFTSFFVSEKSRIYYHSKGILKKVDPAQERDIWYFRVSRMKENYEINVDPDLANRDAITIFINYKVFDYQNNYIGATGVGLTVYAVKKIIENYRKRYNRNIYFVDQKGDIILSTSGTQQAVKNLKDMEGLSAIAPEILGADTGNFRYERDGKNYYLNTRNIREFKWHLLVEQSDEDTIKTILNTLIINLLLCALVTAVVLILTNYTIKSYQGKLEKMATTDKLTGLHNRQSMDIIASQAEKEFSRSREPMSVILIDIDHFKNVNDRHGHLAGDAVITAVASLIEKQIRKSDMVCRWGGEEFLILMKDCTRDNAAAMAENIRNAVSSAVVIYQEMSFSTTISMGVAQFMENDVFDTAIGRADRALYTAKQNGRNRVEYA